MSALDVMRETEGSFHEQPADLPEFYSFVIRRKWIEQYVRPMEMPTLTDRETGTSILLVTDHYRVRDWDVLEQVLAKKRDVDGDRESGWTRLKKCDDGLTRPRSSINIGDGSGKLELFHKTQSEADKGRKWFDKLAGDAVEFTGRVISDPMGMMQSAPVKTTRTSILSETELPADALADLIEQTLHRMYANWAEESIPALNGKSPKQAIKTASGLERVKGLLRSYEEGEREQAAAQGRRVISYAFLWNAIGVNSD
jgi:hypothetical protein